MTSPLRRPGSLHPIFRNAGIAFPGRFIAIPALLFLFAHFTDAAHAAQQDGVSERAGPFEETAFQRADDGNGVAVSYANNEIESRRAFVLKQGTAGQTALIPMPKEMRWGGGERALPETLTVQVNDPALEPLKAFLTGMRGDLYLTLADTGLGPEGYQLEVRERRIAVTGESPAGVFYGLQTLKQLMPEVGNAIPLVFIRDRPRFPYRGLMLDVGRHFMPPEYIKRFIDQMARYKFNRFHWHLTDDQGWRIEIKKYPRLTEVGSTRTETLIGRVTDPHLRYDGTPHGGFYTQEEIREIVRYAAARHVTVIPEIEMPGHSTAALAAYPHLACTQGSFAVSKKWGVHDNIYCPREKTFRFLEDVLGEVMDLFPGRYIHIGGDEAPKTQWKTSAAQAVIQREGLESEQQLQSYFIRRIEKFVNAKGRWIIGWDEIIEGGLAPNATVMSWRGMAGGIAAAKAGHDVVMAPSSHTYFDYYQSNARGEPLAIGGHTPIEKVYAFEPVPDSLSKEEASHILGAQGQLWTEYMKTGAAVDYMAYPRALALAEVVWSPRETKDWFHFVQRLDRHMPRLQKAGIPVARSLYDVDIALANDSGLPSFALKSRVAGGQIRFTQDGSPPKANSSLYDGRVIPLTGAGEIRAQLFRNGRPLGNVAVQTYTHEDWQRISPFPVLRKAAQ